jgi:hypothetical protein
MQYDLGVKDEFNKDLAKNLNAFEKRIYKEIDNRPITTVRS